MNPTRRRAAIVTAMMVASAAGAAWWRPTTHLADLRPRIELETLFPKAFGGWVIDRRVPVQLVSPDQAAVLNAIYNQTLSRTYANPAGERIMLSVAYGGDQSDATRAHRPEVCYPAQGFQIMAASTAALRVEDRTIRVRRLVARQGGRNEPITYWIMVGDKVTVSGTEQKFAQLAYSMRGVIPDGMLVRISSIDHDIDKAYWLHERFLADLGAAIEPGKRAPVIGVPTSS